MHGSFRGLIISLFFLAWAGLPLCADDVTPWTQLSTAAGDLEVPNNGDEQTACQVFDVDGDGVNDIVIAERTQAPGVVWYRRLADGWQRYVIDEEVVLIEAGGAFGDIDGDGDLDVSFGGDYTSNQVWWWENPAPDFDPDTPWSRYLIKDSGGTKHHDQVFGDFDGDGELELAFWHQHWGDNLYVSEIPADPQNTAPWPYVGVFDGADNCEGLKVADIDVDGVDDIVGAGYWFKYVDDETFTANVIVSGREFTRTAVGDLIPGGRPEVVIVPGDSDGPLDYYEWTGDAWVEYRIKDEVIHGHSVEIGDVDLDGYLDIFVGEMGTPGAGASCQASIFYGNGAGGFDEQVVSVGVASHESRLVDLDGDGDLDIVMKPYAYGAPRLDVFLNETAGTGQTLDEWECLTVDNDRVRWGGSTAYFGLGWGDIDGDGLLDLVSGRYFYRNPGDDMADTPWPSVEFDVGVNVDVSLVVDVDNDAFGDVIGSTGPGIYWLEADDVDGTSWSVYQIDDNAPYDGGHLIPQGYEVADIVPGGQLEIIFNNGDRVYYYEVPESDPESGEWPMTLVGDQSNSEGIGIGDIDGDGWLDIVAAHWPGSGPWCLKWLHNPGDGSGDWVEYVVGEAVPVGENQRPDRVVVADINGDELLDIVVSEEISLSPASTYWFEAPADPTQAGWTCHNIVTQYTMNNLDVADMDNDGDMDVVTQEHRGTKKLQVWENDGLGNFTEHLIDSGYEGHLGARVADLDQDGDNEIFSIAYDAYTHLYLWRNDNGTGTGPTNRAPVAYDDEFTVGLSQEYAGQLSASDPDEEDVLEYTIVSAPTAGSLSSFDSLTGAFTYEAPAEVTTDSFTFRVTDGELWSNVATVAVTVADLGWPVAVIQVDAGVPGIAPADVTFDATGSYDTDGDIIAYEWDFDDGTTSAESVVEHTFEQNGVYAVTLTVTDDEQRVGTATVDIYVGAIGAGLTGYWPLDEGSGLTAADQTVFANDLTLHNGAGWTAGVYGAALLLDGTDEYASRPDSQLHGAIPAKSDGSGEDFTVAVWIYLDYLGVRHALVQKQGDEQRGFNFTVEPTNRLTCELFRDQSVETELSSSTTLEAQQWYHVALTYDHVADGNSVARLYVDGVVVAESLTAVGPVVPNLVALNFGRYRWSSSYQRYLAGRMDEARLYDRALSGFEIETLSWWPADGDYDDSGMIDFADASQLMSCLTGPDRGGSSDCRHLFDFDRDLDVDQADLLELQLLFGQEAP